MKRISTLFLSAFCAATLMAQNLSTIVFVDKDGNEIANGSTISITTAEEDEVTGDAVLYSGISVKNKSADDAAVRISVDVQRLDNGLFQICFPTACITKNATGAFETGSDQMSAGEVRNLQTEWTATTAGSTTVTYQADLMTQLSGFPPQYEFRENGPKITVSYTYDPTAIQQPSVANATAPASATGYYSLDGRQLRAPQHGISIVRMSDGTIRKQLNANH